MFLQDALGDTTLLLESRQALAHGTETAPVAGRVTFATVALLSLSLLVACFAIRVKNLRLHDLSRMNTSRALVISIYLCGIIFILSSSLLQFGATITTTTRCKTAIIMCLVFYVGGKVMMYAFLCERMHAVRQNYLSRWKDMFWVTAILVVLVGFGIIAVMSFFWPVYDISKVDGRCRIGLPFRITLPLLIYDILVNASLTAVFFYLVSPYMRKGVPNFLPTWFRKFTLSILRLFCGQRFKNTGQDQPTALDQRGLVERVAWKSLAACVAVLCSTVANLSVLFYMHGYEQSWLCFTLCTIDISWGAIVVHRLTHDPKEVDHGDPRLISTTTSQFNNSAALTVRSRTGQRSPIPQSHRIGSTQGMNMLPP